MKAYLLSVNPQADVTVYPLHAPKGKTDMIRIKIPGTRGKSKGMDAPVEMAQVNAEEVSDELDAIVSVDTTKGNRIINHRGIAVSNTVKEGYILRCSEDLLDIMERVTGRLPQVFSLSTQDITPYANNLYHLNSILQPCTATAAPTVGLAIVTESAVAGCATGITQFADVEAAARFLVETAKDFGRGVCSFYNKEEYAELLRRYSSLAHLQTTRCEN